MRGGPASIKLLRPKDETEAVRLYSKNPEALPIAGGTDVMVSWNAGLLNGRTILDLSPLSSWKRIKETPSGLWIGALTTHSELREHPAIKASFPLLADAAATVGGLQIQNRGTLGGNIANASPAGDSFPALAVYEAKIHAVSSAGRRAIPISEIFIGVKKTALGKGELIQGIELPFLNPAPSASAFRKVGTRAAQAISKTIFSGLIWLDKKGVIDDARLAFGSMAPTVRRLRHIESYLTGQKLTQKTIAAALGLIQQDLSPIDDIRSTRAYRLHVSGNILWSFLESLI